MQSRLFILQVYRNILRYKIWHFRSFWIKCLICSTLLPIPSSVATVHCHFSIFRDDSLEVIKKFFTQTNTKSSTFQWHPSFPLIRCFPWSYSLFFISATRLWRMYLFQEFVIISFDWVLTTQDVNKKCDEITSNVLIEINEFPLLSCSYVDWRKI